MIYVYGIVEAGNEPGEVPRGLGGAEVDYAARGDVAGVFSSIDGSTIEPTEALLWDHERVVESLMQSGPVLPVRFGSLLGDVGELLEKLEARGPSLRDALQRVTGAVEVSVRALDPHVQDAARPAVASAGPETEIGAASAGPETEPGDGPGRAYLLSRRRAVAPETLKELEAIHATLEALARDATFTLAEQDHKLVAAYLVEQRDLRRFADRVEQLQEESPGLELTCTGPWPPYNFVGDQGVMS